MKYLGKGKIISDDLAYLDRGDIIDIYEYEPGDETEEGKLFSPNDDLAPKYATSYGGPDLYEDEVELIIAWIPIEDGLPNESETVFVSNGKGWTTLGCLVYAEDGFHWAASNGLIYQEDGKIVSECESDDLGVKFWHRLPEPPCL